MTEATPKHRVVVFEDTPDSFEHLRVELQPRCRELNAELVWFPPDHAGEPDKEVERFLLRPTPADLVVVDWDLSKYPGVSRHLVRGVVSEHRLPVCLYESKTGDNTELQRLMNSMNEEIVVSASGDFGTLAKRCAAVLKGFLELRDTLCRFPGSRLEDRIIKAMGAPGAAEASIREYAIGGRRRLLEVMSKDSDQEKTRVAATVIGYWIHNQILQFPGVLLNEVAAASYLDVELDTFRLANVTAFFAEARYSGPFAALGPYYWLPVLDEIVADHMTAEDGEEISGHEALRRDGIKVERASCFHGHEGAGYYCLIRKVAVCAEHSKRPRFLTPVGADRSRIENEKFEELSAWLDGEL